MPQMSPLSWAPLMLFAITLVTTFMTNIFWASPTPPMPKLAPPMTKNLTWKW